MATKVFIGGAQPKSMVRTFTTGGTLGTGDTAAVVINRKEVSLTVLASETAAAFALRLYDALTAEASAEFREVTWSYPGTGAVVTGTAATPGVPFTATTSVTGTITLTASTTVTSKGPAHLSDVDNWSSGSLPVNADIAVFEADTGEVLYDLDALSGVSLAAAVVRGGAIGLPDLNPGGYPEYRPKNLVLADCTALTVLGSVDRLRLDLASGGSCTARVDAGAGATFTTTDAADATIRLVGAGTFAVLEIVSGQVGVAMKTGEAATVTSLTVGTQSAGNGVGGSDEDATVILGAGAAVAAAAQYGGTVTSEAASVDLTQSAGTWRQNVSNFGDVSCTGGTFDYRPAGTLGACTFFGEDALFDLSGGTRSAVPSSLSVKGGAGFIDPHKRIGTLGYATDRQSLARSEIGDGFTITRS